MGGLGLLTGKECDMICWARLKVEAGDIRSIPCMIGRQAISGGDIN